MKNVLFIMAFACTIQVVYAQRKASTEVETAFKKMFPKAEKVKYSLEKDMSWEIDFKEGKVKSSAHFSPKGEWLETEQSLAFEKMPQAVQNFVKTTYAGFKIEECELVKTAEKTFYEIEVEKGKKEFALIISPEGNLLEEKPEEND